jgi:hypothetical protein
MSLKLSINRQLLKISGNSFMFHDLGYYVAPLRESAPYSFSRFGDGEWSAILGMTGANCDGHEYFPELGADLRRALIEHRGYFYGMQTRALKNLGRPLRRFLRDNNLKISWHDSDVFHYCSTAGTLFLLIQQLRRMKIVLIGPERLRGLKDTVFSYDHFIEIPLKNCYLVKDAVIGQIRDYYRDHGPAVFGFSASMATNVMIHELFPLLGSSSWLLDFGSLWDAYVGVNSRGGKSGDQWDAIMKRNINGRA